MATVAEGRAVLAARTADAFTRAVSALLPAWREAGLGSAYPGFDDEFDLVYAWDQNRVLVGRNRVWHDITVTEPTGSDQLDIVVAPRSHR